MADYTQDILDILGYIHFFDMLDENQLLQLSEQLTTVFFKQEEILFEEGMEADGFYIILSGRVSLQSNFDHEPKEISIKNRGDYFGEEGLKTGGNRELSAIAITNVIAIHIDQDQLFELMETYPQIIEPIQLTVKSYYLFLQQPFKWRAPRESIHFVARKHNIFLWFQIIPPLLIGLTAISITTYYYFFDSQQPAWLAILLAVSVIFFLGWFIWKLIDWSNDFSIITNRRVVSLEKVALFYESRQEAPLDAILSVETNSGQIGRWIGYGDVVIRTYTGVINFKKLAKSELVVRLINDERGRANIQTNRNQRHSKENILRNRIGYDPKQLTAYEEDYEEVEDDQIEVPHEVQSSKIMEFLSTFFGLRVEKNGVITYRTHWFILLKRIIWPSLAMILLFLTFIFSLFQYYPSTHFDIIVYVHLGLGFIASLWLLYQYWDWRNDRYIITDEQLIDLYKRPLGEEQKRSAPIKNIQTVEFERLGIISLILNFGTVFIRVGDTTFTFDYVFNPSEAQQDIFERYQKFNQKQKQREKESLRDEVAEWIEIYHQVIQNKAENTEDETDEENSGYNIGEY
ncbi:MAG TPA: cyclic nucleotide-binding domain-containing protein [Anaerolineaceae bacterium]|nr:cyclic nucleotide-binding domain-containing protein [Anaerolineaceae bacterium]